jgi:flavin reductase
VERSARCAGDILEVNVADPAQFKQGMRRLASGVTVVTTHADDQPHGFSATSVTSVSADPAPVLLVCVSKSVSCHDKILQSGSFCVNVLSECEIETARLFSSPEQRDRRFGSCAWRPLVTGAPALINALANFDCRIRHSTEVQTHTVFFGEVVHIELRGHEIHPLVYANGEFGGIRSASPLRA